ncbi:uncharacterized protein IUM83_14492 [Phytophthora cinnamomi]|uniref:uncharacterized protein n=1 Tax=Phytophthora cinnamomi TaxID=4785 RepID=UPI00355A85CF|nr:hypothetical protein IUM83_14492 [Phytophthora cinnamomi]
MEEDCKSDVGRRLTGNNDIDGDDQDTGSDDAGYAFPDEADSADQDVVMKAEEFEQQASATTTKQPDASAAEQQRRKLAFGLMGNVRFSPSNFYKKEIYALMVENLQADCTFGIVDPFQELDRLNPGCAHP